MDLPTTEALAKAALRLHGLSSWTFQFDSAKRRAGICRHYQHIISLSRHYVLLNGLAEVRDTILHEVAHALVGPSHGHDWAWKQQAAAIGARPVRCYDSSVVVMPKGSVAASCEPCGKVYRRHRMPKKGIVYGCNVCHARLTWVRIANPDD